MIYSFVLAACNNNGAQDNEETGVDCGGGGCADCGTFQNKYFHYHYHNQPYKLYI